MRVEIVSRQRMREKINEQHNPPDIPDPQSEDEFRSEIKHLHDQLVKVLSSSGNGRHFELGCDFEIDPNPDGPTPWQREFWITITSEELLKISHIPLVHNFIVEKAADYRIRIDQDVHPSLQQIIIHTPGNAWITCNQPEELKRVVPILEAI